MNIFTDEYFDHFRLDDLSIEVIEAVEKKLKVKLPEAYIEFMKVQNGGELKLKKYVHPSLEDGFIEIEYLYGIGQKSGEGILIDSYIRKEWGLSNRFVYLNGDSHNWIALDYRRYTGDNPPVVYIDQDTNEKCKIAENFTEFIGRLTEMDEQVQVDVRHDEEFTREEIEEALLNGWHKYNMTAGLHHFGLKDENLNWFLTQMTDSIKRMMEVHFFAEHSTIDYYLNIIIDIIRKRKVDFSGYPQTDELLEILTNFPSTMDYNSMIRNKSLKIKRYLAMEQEKR